MSGQEPVAQGAQVDMVAVKIVHAAPVVGKCLFQVQVGDGLIGQKGGYPLQGRVSLLLDLHPAGKDQEQKPDPLLPGRIPDLLEHGVTGFSAVPALWTELLAGDPEELGKCLDQVRYVTISAGDLSPDQHASLRRLGPETAIFKTYGQTETFRSAMLFPHEYDQKTGSVGRAVEGCQVLIIDPRGRPLGPDQEGQIVHQGPGTMLGYLADPLATAKKLKPDPRPSSDRADPGGVVVHTGDQGRLDQEGYLYVLGRKDKMVKIRGNRVYPQEILNQLMAHPEVKEAACLAVKDKAGRSVIIAEVLPGEGTSPQVPELIRFLAQRLPSYMVPARVELVRSFPRTPSGKIRLAELEARYSD